MRIFSFLRAVILAAVVGILSSASAQELYVGTNYHPHDSNPETWRHDITLMKTAGFRVVRMGHLAWDSYEPSDGRFAFAWFDQVMDMMNEAGIKVILDIAVRPAPIRSDGPPCLGQRRALRREVCFRMVRPSDGHDERGRDKGDPRHRRAAGADLAAPEIPVDEHHGQQWKRSLS